MRRTAESTIRRAVDGVPRFRAQRRRLHLLGTQGMLQSRPTSHPWSCPDPRSFQSECRLAPIRWPISAPSPARRGCASATSSLHSPDVPDHLTNDAARKNTPAVFRVALYNAKYKRASGPLLLSLIHI